MAERVKVYNIEVLELGGRLMFVNRPYAGYLRHREKIPTTVKSK